MLQAVHSPRGVGSAPSLGPCLCTGGESIDCPLCKESTPQGKFHLIRHIGQHLEEISLAVLTTAYPESACSSEADTDDERKASSTTGESTSSDERLDEPPASGPQNQPAARFHQNSDLAQQSAESVAREVLGPLVHSPTRNFLLPQAQKLTRNEWEIIKNTYERYPRTRDDLPYLSQVLDKETNC